MTAPFINTFSDNSASGLNATERPSSTPPRRANTKKFTDVCDQCRWLKIKCNYQQPCDRCQKSNMRCTRDYAPRKRGPKPGSGRVVHQLRAQYPVERGAAIVPDTAASSAADPQTPSAPPSPAHPEIVPGGNEQLLVRKCVGSYLTRIYPIMPILYIPDIEKMLQGPQSGLERVLLLALSAKTCFHMRGRELIPEVPVSWDDTGRELVRLCEREMKSIDGYDSEPKFYHVVVSLCLSTAWFEIGNGWKASRYLREAISFAVELRLHDETSYDKMPSHEQICRRRTFWLLFITERALAIVRRTDTFIKRTPELPAAGYEQGRPEIHTGFVRLVSLYKSVDESFIRHWIDGSIPALRESDIVELQNKLAGSFPVLDRSNQGLRSQLSAVSPGLTVLHQADIAITRQWLRLALWRHYYERNLITADPSTHECLRISFPVIIARDTAILLRDVPIPALRAHGMGILQKIYDISYHWVLSLRAGASMSQPLGTGQVLRADSPSNMSSGERLERHSLFDTFHKTLALIPESCEKFAKPLQVWACSAPSILDRIPPELTGIPATSRISSNFSLSATTTTTVRQGTGYPPSISHVPTSQPSDSAGGTLWFTPATSGSSIYPGMPSSAPNFLDLSMGAALFPNSFPSTTMMPQVTTFPNATTMSFATASFGMPLDQLDFNSGPMSSPFDMNIVSHANDLELTTEAETPGWGSMPTLEFHEAP